MSLRDSILAADDSPRVKVPCSEWGTDVFVRTLSASERDRFESDTLVKRGKVREANLLNLRARLVALTVCDENGVRVFSDSDVEALSAKSSKVLDRLFAVAKDLSGMTDADVEEQVKN
jgi:hypothetical protein